MNISKYQSVIGLIVTIQVRALMDSLGKVWGISFKGKKPTWWTGLKSKLKTIRNAFCKVTCPENIYGNVWSVLWQVADRIVVWVNHCLG